MNQVDYFIRVSYSTTRSGGTFSKVGRRLFAIRRDPSGRPTNISRQFRRGVSAVRRRVFSVTIKMQYKFLAVTRHSGRQLDVEKDDRRHQRYILDGQSFGEGNITHGRDGSYNPNKSTLISGAGWIICCST